MNQDESLTNIQSLDERVSEDVKELDAILNDGKDDSTEPPVIENGADHEEPVKKKSKKRTFLFTVLFIVANVAAILVTALLDFGGQDGIQPFSSVWGVFKENGVYALIALC